MLVAAALVPDTALLVPGAAGAADVLADLRTAALDAVTRAVAGATRVVVVAPGPVTCEPGGRVRASLGAAGVPDAALGWSVPEVAVDGGEPRVPAVATSVGLHLLARVGWTGTTRLVEVARDPRAELARRGAALVADAPTALVVVGSASGRHGPDAPLADDDRAPAHDARVLADLAAADDEARARLAADDPALAAELAVTGWAPWQVLLGAAGGAPVDATLLAAEAPWGAQHAVVLWMPRGTTPAGG